MRTPKTALWGLWNPVHTFLLKRDCSSSPIDESCQTAVTAEQWEVTCYLITCMTEPAGSCCGERDHAGVLDGKIVKLGVVQAGRLKKNKTDAKTQSQNQSTIEAEDDRGKSE